MTRNLQQRNIFESGFDSFEFDDGFLMKVDLDVKEYKYNKENINEKKVKGLGKSNKTEKEKVKKLLNIKTHYYDSPLLIEDLNESDFFVDKKKQNSPKVIANHRNEELQKASVPNNFMSCLSPIQGPKLTNKINLSSSTPTKPADNSNTNDKREENPIKNSEFDYLEADLFDDWSTNDNVEKNSQRSTVTLSQALQLIEEAESARDRKDELNQSIDLLTGEVVGVDVGIMFDESFGLPKSEKKQEDSKSSDESVIVLENCEVTKKTPAAQKLNFEAVKLPDRRNICFNSDDDDDDFDFLTQELLDKPTKNNFNMDKTNKITKTESSSKDYELNDSLDTVPQFRKRRRKCFNVIESDSTEDSPSPKFKRKNNTDKCFQKNFGKEFIDSEAEVSDVVEVSSDEAEEEGEYDKSFLDEESYFTQNCSANMTSKYLESVKGVNRAGSFKIPASKPYNPINVFSQIPEENNTDYEIDSFCVNEVEEEMNSELSDLEVAEKILEMDRKRRKKKRCERTRKLK